MNIIEQIQGLLKDFVNKKFSVDLNQSASITFNLNVDADKEQFGDISTNIPMVLSKEIKSNPKVIAEQITNNFKHEFIDKIEVAGPGFINIFLTRAAIIELAKELFEKNEKFFQEVDTNKHKYNIEFVSANPTGPLHVGHGRGGIIGDVLGNILSFLGNPVTKEFYINDAGNQMQKLGESFKIRCEQVSGLPAKLPEDGYQGEYLLELAKKCKAEFGGDLSKQPAQFFIDYAKKNLLGALEETLKKYGINYNVWFSETKLHQSHAIVEALEILKRRHYLYEKDGACWFRSTAFGDDKDRVVKKISGEYTYVAADIAYLKNKVDRGFDKLVMVLGQDHHSYLVRLKAVAQALGYDPKRLDIILYQLVTVKESGEVLRLSKRAGRMITLEDIIDTVGKDVARFFYLNKKADAHLDFDLELALKHTDENPVYYIQYAYVRTISIMEKSKQQDEQISKALSDIKLNDCKYLDQSEKLLIKKIISLKDLLQSISQNNQTHLLAYYVIELAKSFHSYYSINKVIDPNNIEQSRGRLLLVLLIQRTLKTSFDLLGISAPEKM